MAHLKTASEVIDALGGTSAVRRMTRRNFDQAVSNWRRADRIPCSTFLVMQHALKKHGHTARPEIWGIRSVANH